MKIPLGSADALVRSLSARHSDQHRHIVAVDHFGVFHIAQDLFDLAGLLALDPVDLAGVVID